jgi:BNR repeat-like domain
MTYETASTTGGEDMRRRLLAAGAIATIFALGVASAGNAAVDRRTAASGVSPFPAICNTQPQNGPLFLNSEVEPWIDVDPTSAGDADGANLIGVYQQDRYGTGGARGLGTSVSTNGGQSYTPLTAAQLPKFSQCAGNPLYERASDPWVSFAPTGTAHQISLSFNDTANLDNAVLVSRSTKAQGGTTWSAPITLKRDTSPTVFNDKESLTADQNPGANGLRYVYAIWDRLVFPTERSKGVSFLTTAAFRGPTWFARSTNDGATWEPAHPIYDPGQNDQTIGNQIVALGNTDLVNVMTVFKNDNAGGNRGGRVAVLRSEDRGSSWSGPITVSRLGTVEVTDPETGDPVRTGDIIPEIASDERAGFQRDQVAFSRSTDGGGTWSTPVRISQHNDTQAFTPAVRVDANGNIGVTYYDFRNNDPATPALETDTWFTRSTDGGATWSEERVTPTSFDMRTAPVARGFFTGDYEGLTALGGDFWSLVSESRGATDAWSARLTSPFAAASYTPSANENNTPPAKAFPVAKGRPAPA